MEEELKATKEYREKVQQYISDDVPHPDPDWSWSLELDCLDHDIEVMEYAVEKGYEDFNEAYDAFRKE